MEGWEASNLIFSSAGRVFHLPLVKIKKAKGRAGEGLQGRL